MIEHQMIDGRNALVVYMNEKFEPSEKDSAVLIKVIFENGERIFLTPGKNQVMET